MKKVEKARLLLLETALKKHNQLMSGSAFPTDFAAAEIIKNLVTEIKILSLENKKYKKIIEVQNLYIKKKESEIKRLQNSE